MLCTSKACDYPCIHDFSYTLIEGDLAEETVVPKFGVAPRVP